jgi:LPS-assembly lipoprotein
MKTIRHPLLALCLLATAMLSACGFQLRGSQGPAALAFSTIYISLPTTSELHAMLKRSIEASSATRVVDSPQDAQAILTITTDSQTKNILSLNTSGRVREYELVRTFGFRLHDKTGQDWLPPSQFFIRRDIAFNDSAILAKEAEEVNIVRDMQNDLAQQLLRRLAAAKPPK